MKTLLFIKTKILIMIVLMLFLFSGCWNRRELSQIGILGAVGIDADENMVGLTYEIINPKRIESKGGDEEVTSYLQSEGKSMFEANRNATLKYNKKIFWPHVNMLFFNKKAGDIGILKYLDYFNRNHESRRFVNIAIVKGCPAYEIMGIDGGEGEIPSEYVESLFENIDANGKGVSTKIIDFLKAYFAQGIEPVMGVIQPVKRNDTKLKVTQKENEEYMPSTEGIAVFREDKLIGFLDGIESRGYNFVTDKIKSGVIVSASTDMQGTNSIEIIKASGNLEVKIEDEKYYGTVKVEVNGMLNEETGKEDISNFKAIKKIEENTSDLIKNEIDETIKKVQGFKTDVFGFGQEIHRKYPAKWKNIKTDWNDIFSKMQIEIKVKINIQKAGVSNEQLTVKEQK